MEKQWEDVKKLEREAQYAAFNSSKDDSNLKIIFAKIDAVNAAKISLMHQCEDVLKRDTRDRLLVNMEECDKEQVGMTNLLRGLSIKAGDAKKESKDARSRMEIIDSLLAAAESKLASLRTSFKGDSHAHSQALMSYEDTLNEVKDIAGLLLHTGDELRAAGIPFREELIDGRQLPGHYVAGHHVAGHHMDRDNITFKVAQGR